MDIREYDVLTMKKPHPCGGLRWQVLRNGADFRLRCLGCGRCVEGPRGNFEKNIRRIERDGAEITVSSAARKQAAKEGDD